MSCTCNSLHGFVGWPAGVHKNETRLSTQGEQAQHAPFGARGAFQVTTSLRAGAGAGVEGHAVCIGLAGCRNVLHALAATADGLLQTRSTGLIRILRLRCTRGGCALRLAHGVLAAALNDCLHERLEASSVFLIAALVASLAIGHGCTAVVALGGGGRAAVGLLGRPAVGFLAAAAAAAVRARAATAVRLGALRRAACAAITSGAGIAAGAARKEGKTNERGKDRLRVHGQPRDGGRGNVRRFVALSLRQSNADSNARPRLSAFERKITARMNLLRAGFRA